MVVKILNGDCREMLKTLPDNSVNCCITSPPYYGLRDYGTAKWEGGNPDCDHNNLPECDRDPKNPNANSHIGRYNRVKCYKCGAVRVDRQIGLEQSPEEYVENLVNVFREVKRVLKNDGTLWLNLGDSYWGGKGQSGSGNPKEQEIRNNNGESLNKAYHQIAGDKLTRPTDGKHAVIKPKDLIGIPWRVAFALQADGWYLRQDIIWSKNNPMPESVRDRCTKSHEYIFLLSKSGKYYFDNEAIKEPAIQAGKPRYDSFKGRQGGASYQGSSGGEGGNCYGYIKKNKRSVWQINTKPYKGAHFATFPIDLVEPCGLAGCPENGIILDPFGGSGTVGQWCNLNGRNAVLIELNPEYIPLIEERINTVPKPSKKKVTECIEEDIETEEELSIEDLEKSMNPEEQDSYYNLLLGVPFEYFEMVRKAYWVEKGVV